MPDARGARTRLHLAFTLLVVIALVVAVAATLIAGRLQPPATGAGPGILAAPLRISTLRDAGLACPFDAAFSPDGGRIAVMGTLGACPAPVHNDAGERLQYVAAVFNSATGALLRTYPLDALLEPGNARFAVRVTRVAYAGLGWSPDGAHLAVAFTEFGGIGQRLPENLVNSGLLVVDTASGTADVLRGDSDFFTTASGASAGFPIWHLGDGTELSSFVPEPGLAYAWGQDGTPTATQRPPAPGAPLPAGVGQRSPVGNPSGGNGYTIWQPGVVVGPASTGLGGDGSAFVTAFPAWSPDGAHVTLMVAGVTLAAPLGQEDPRMKEPALSAGPPVPLPPALPPAPARDVAIEEVQQEVGLRGWALVAWNPDGSLLGSIQCGAARDTALEVRDTATGRVVGWAAFPLTPDDAGCRDTSGVEAQGAYPDLHLELRWSPAGNRVLVTDRAAGTLTLWQARQP